MFLSSFKQSGFSLVQGLVVAGVLAGSALVGSELIKQQKLSVKETQTRDAVEQLHLTVFSILQNRDHCLTTMLNNNNAGTPIASQAATLAANATYTLSSGIFLKGQASPTIGLAGTSSYINRTVAINSITITNAATLASPSTVTVQYIRQTKAQKGGRTTGMYDLTKINKSFKLVIQRDTSSTWQSCYAVQQTDAYANAGNDTLHSNFCAGLGTTSSLFQWDATLNTCKLKNNVCASGLIFTGINVATGDAICAPMTNYMSNFIDTSTTYCNPATANNVRFVKTSAYTVRIDCGASTSCTGTTMNWTGPAGDACTAAVGGAVHMATQTATDSTGPSMGSASYTCNNGVWIPNAGETCSGSFISCAANASVSWSGTGTCTGSLPLTATGASVTINDSTDPTRGSATYTCTNGTWSGATSTSCDTACPSQSLTWAASASCNATIGGYAAHGATDTITSTNGNMGTASYTCNQGTWNLQAGQTCAVSRACYGSGGRCRCTLNGVDCGVDWGCCNSPGCTGSGSTLGCP